MAASNAREYQLYIEVLNSGTSFARDYQQYMEVLNSGTSNSRNYQIYSEVLTFAGSAGRSYHIYMEVIGPAPGQTFNETASNTLSMTGSATVTWDRAFLVSQSLTLVGAASATRRIDATATNTLTLTGLASYSLGYFPANTLTLSQTAVCNLSVERSITSTLVLTQTAMCNVYRDIAVSQSLTFAQEAHVVVDQLVDSVLTLTHDVDVVKSRHETVPQSLTLTQSLSKELLINRTVNQGMLFVHAATRNIYKVVSASNTLALTQTATNTLTKLASNTLVLTQDATYVLGKHIHQSFEITQIASCVVYYSRAVFSNFIPFQVLARNTTIRRTLESTLTLTQSAIGHLVKSGHNTLVFTQSATGVAAKPASSTLVFTQTLTFTRAFGKVVNSPLALVQTVGVQVSKAVLAYNVVSFTQSALGKRVYVRSATNALVLSQEVVRDRTLENVPQTLALAHSVMGRHIANRALASTLSLTHAVSVSKTFNREVVDTLVFQSSHEKFTGISSHPTIDVPNIQVVKIDPKCLVILQNGTLSIVLPCPEFGDSEGGMGSVNIKRSMAGGRRVYMKDTPTSKLNYQFVLDRKKAIELRNFILNSNTSFIRMQNWKGELWAVQMTNSPFTFGEDAAWLDSMGGNRSSITLEFEGVRLN